MFFNPAYLFFMAPAFILMFLTKFYVNATYRNWQSCSPAIATNNVYQFLSCDASVAFKVNGMPLFSASSHD
jgi:hypothetical protein